jgi:hypothetical protein
MFVLKCSIIIHKTLYNTVLTIGVHYSCCFIIIITNSLTCLLTSFFLCTPAVVVFFFYIEFLYIYKYWRGDVIEFKLILDLYIVNQIHTTRGHNYVLHIITPTHFRCVIDVYNGQTHLIKHLLKYGIISCNFIARQTTTHTLKGQMLTKRNNKRSLLAYLLKMHLVINF